MSQYSKYSEKVDLTNNKNLIIRCPYSKCHARIIKPSLLPQVETEKVEFNDLKFLSTSEDEQNEIPDGDFLKVGDAWDFDNIGVSREFKSEEQVPIERLLICPDCERGPLGFARFEEGDQSNDVKNLSYFLHLNSVLYQL